MKKIKYKYFKISKSDVVYPVITQPSMAFTPRQIIEQFASGEVVAQENQPTDDFYDDKYTEEQLFAINMIDDDFMLRQRVIDYFENQNDKKENVNSGTASEAGSDRSSDKDDESSQPAESGE